MSHELGDTELTTDAAVRDYCERARKAFRQLAIELNMAAEELQAFLVEVPEPPAGTGLSSSSKRARLVAGHIRGAADASTSAAASMIRCWRSMEKHYAVEMGRTPTRVKKPAFKFEGS